ncbi:MAG TPA: ABC transporter permease [Streptosporangiaceae bacterium]|jgi:peptide/nickel transport system permease protein
MLNRARSLTLFIVRRFAGLCLTLLVASFAIFGALYLQPSDPIAFLAHGRQLSPQSVAILRAEYHLDQPFLVRYWEWLTSALHGDLGQSLVTKTAVSTLISGRIGTTVFLLAYGSLLIIVFGVLLGIVSALRRGLVGGAITAGLTVGIAMPSFVAAIILITVFAVQLSWFPAFGQGAGFADRLWHLTLPAIALALSATAYLSRLTRSAVRDELGREHVETARGRGIPWRLILRRHVVRNAMIPITTVSAITIAALMVGTAVVETAFGIAGLGSLLVQSVSDGDFAVVQGIALLLVTGFVVINTIVDVLYAVLDPRIDVPGLAVA